MATTVTVIHRTLPHPVSKHLDIEKFSGQKSTEMLTLLVEKLVFDPAVAFKLGGNALDRLLEIFTYNDFAVKRFLSGYKVWKECAMQKMRIRHLLLLCQCCIALRLTLLKHFVFKLTLDTCVYLSLTCSEN